MSPCPITLPNSTLPRLLLATATVALAIQSHAQVPDTSIPNPARLSRIEDLGRQLFNDRNLSEPRGTACIDCHAPNRGFAGNNGSTQGVSLGSRPTSLGGRNGMSNAYTAFIPPFSFRARPGLCQGGRSHCGV